MKAILRNTVFAMLVALVNFTNPVAADLATIDFDGFAQTSTFGGGVEDDYLITGINGPIAVSSQYLGAFSGVNSIHHQSAGQAGFEIVHTLGSLFELESFMAGSAFGGADPLTISGFVGGTLVGTDVFDPNPADSYYLFNPTNLSGIQVDRLVFDMGPAGPGPTHLDDIVLDGPSSVPEPSATLLGFAGLFAICLRRKR